MASDLFGQIGFDRNGFLKQLNDLKSKGGDPNQIIQQMLNSGRVTQAHVNAASNRAQMIMQMLAPNGRR